MCGRYILNADKTQLIGQTKSFIERIWQDGNCDSKLYIFILGNGGKKDWFIHIHTLSVSLLLSNDVM